MAAFSLIGFEALFRAFSRKARSVSGARAAELDEKSVDALPVIWLEATLSSYLHSLQNHL